MLKQLPSLLHPHLLHPHLVDQAERRQLGEDQLLSVALGSHSKWCSVIMAVRDPAQTALSCSKVGMPSAMEEFFQAYYIIAIHLHIVFLQVIAFAWVCLKADSQEKMIVHKR